ncbi:unnamed protein product, partial [Closterium sp. NIES-54]
LPCPTRCLAPPARTLSALQLLLSYYCRLPRACPALPWAVALLLPPVLLLLLRCCYCSAAAAAARLLLLLGCYCRLSCCCCLRCFCRLRCCCHLCCCCCAAAAAARLLLPPELLLPPALLLPPVLLLLRWCSATATYAAAATCAAAAAVTAAPAVCCRSCSIATPTVLAFHCCRSTVLSCLVVLSASSGSTEGGDPTAADTATSRRSPRLETPPGFLPRTPSPPLQPVAADFGGPGIVGGGDAGGAGSGFAAFGGARSPLVGGVGGTSAGDAGAGSAGSGGALQSLSRRPIFLEQPSSSLPEPTPTCTTPPLLFPTPESPLPAPARYVPLSVSLTGRREPVSCAASPAPSRVTREPVVLPLPPPSSLPAILDPVSDLARAARPTIPCCRAALVIAPASSHAVACALVAELAGFAATCRRAYLAGLVSASSCPPSVGGELAHGCDILEDRQFELEYLPYPLSMRTRYVAPGRHHPAHWRAARRVLRYLVRLASIT